jgi:hypothetical protein
MENGEKVSLMEQAQQSVISRKLLKLKVKSHQNQEEEVVSNLKYVYD